jgi:NAD(P)-dependent dehydrogenase (short-subunit alcohol dehydrogenase family)
MIARVSMLLKSQAPSDMLPFSQRNKTNLEFGTLTDSSSNDTIDSVLRHRELGQAKDESAPSRNHFQGTSSHLCFADGSPDDLKKMMDLNVLGLNVCTQQALKSMKDRGVDDGHIIHINR